MSGILPGAALVNAPALAPGAAPAPAAPVVAPAAAAAAPKSNYLAGFQAKKAAMQQKFADRSAQRTAARQAAMAPKPVAPAAPLSSIDQLGKDYEERAFKANAQPSDNIQGNAKGGYIAPQKYGRHPAKWDFKSKPKGA